MSVLFLFELAANVQGSIAGWNQRTFAASQATLEVVLVNAWHVARFGSFSFRGRPLLFFAPLNAFERQADLSFVGIHSQHFDLDILANFDHFLGVPIFPSFI